MLVNNVRKLTTSAFACGFKQKTSWNQYYEWFLDVKKSRKRATNPWIPREPAIGCIVEGKHVEVPEMIAEFVVPPDLDKFELKPYVDWRAETVEESPHIPERIYSEVYARKVVDAFDKGVEDKEILKLVD